MPHTPPSTDHCLNCGQVLGPVRPKFCPECGQETNVRAPTMREFAQHFGGNYIAAEGALWRTLALLFVKPGQLTREYLAGRRRHYVLPLRLYLTISLVAFIALRVATTLQFALHPGSAINPDKSPNLSVGLGIGRTGLKDGVFFCEKLPDWFCRRMERRLDLEPKNVRHEVEQAIERFVSHLGTAMFLLVPTFAMWLKLAYLNRRLRYTEHLVFALHLHSFWFATIVLTQLPLSWLADVAVLAIPVYAVLAAQRVYGGRWWATLLRNAAVAAAYSVTLVLAMGMVGVWALLG